MISIGIVGITGKVGRNLCTQLLDHPDIILIWGVSSSLIEKEDPLLKLYPSLTITTLDKADFSQVDIIVDFSTASISHDVIQKTWAHNKKLIMGTTGLSDQDFAMMKKAAEEIPILYSPNFSPGIQIFIKLMAQVYALSQPADVTISETHHIEKKDTPSGTAIMLASHLPHLAPISSKRSESNVGEHTMTFHFKGETLSISHQALSRDLFSLGVIKALYFMEQTPPKLYTFSDLYES
ncbi:MAG: 4-hydroxy-tetrahydrodipicolinate reductase [Rhabdochlamydiaceae bacterium]